MTEKMAAATVTLSSTSTTICCRHSRRNMRHAQRVTARRPATPPPRARPSMSEGCFDHRHVIGPGTSNDSGPAGVAVWSTMRPSRRKTTRSAHEAS